MLNKRKTGSVATFNFIYSATAPRAIRRREPVGRGCFKTGNCWDLFHLQLCYNFHIFISSKHEGILVSLLSRFRGFAQTPSYGAQARHNNERHTPSQAELRARSAAALLKGSCSRDGLLKERPRRSPLAFLCWGPGPERPGRCSMTQAHCEAPPTWRKISKAQAAGLGRCRRTAAGWAVVLSPRPSLPFTETTAAAAGLAPPPSTYHVCPRHSRPAPRPAPAPPSPRWSASCSTTADAQE